MKLRNVFLSMGVSLVVAGLCDSAKAGDWVLVGALDKPSISTPGITYSLTTPGWTDYVTVSGSEDPSSNTWEWVPDLPDELPQN